LEWGAVNYERGRKGTVEREKTPPSPERHVWGVMATHGLWNLEEKSQSGGTAFPMRRRNSTKDTYGSVAVKKRTEAEWGKRSEGEITQSSLRRRIHEKEVINLRRATSRKKTVKKR